MVKKVLAWPLAVKIYLILVGAVFLSTLTYSAFYLFLGQVQRAKTKQSGEIINKATLSPNKPIDGKQNNNKSQRRQDLNYIKATIVAEKFVPKIAYYRASIPYWDQTAAFASFKKNVKLFNFTTVFWYTLRSNGSIRKYTYAVEDKNIITFAHKNKVKLFGLIANLPDDDEGGGWDSERVETLISSKAARINHINAILSLVKKMNFDGISIDYEELETSQKNNFTAFIKELATALHKRGKMLGVAIHPKSGEGIPSEDNGSRAQDLVPLSTYADHLYFMTYGEHWDDSAPGPIASLPWASKVINYALSIGVPRSKIFMGMPLYGLDWPKSGSSFGSASGLTYSQVSALIKTYKPKVIVNTQNSSAYFNYSKSGQTHQVWFENYQTVQARLAFARDLGISATFWRLGREDSRVWTTAKTFH